MIGTLRQTIAGRKLALAAAAFAVVAVVALTVRASRAQASATSTSFGRCQAAHATEVAANAEASAVRAPASAPVAVVSAAPGQATGTAEAASGQSLPALQLPDAVQTIADVGRRDGVDALILVRTKSSTSAGVPPASGTSVVTPVVQAPLPAPGSYLGVVKDTLRRKERTGFILPADYVATAGVAGTTAVALDVCVDRRHPRGVDPGTYTGIVTIGDPRLSELDVPITIRVQERSWILTIILTALIDVVGGTVFVYASGQGQGFGDAGVKSLFERQGLEQIWEWVQANIVPVFAGVAAGSVAFVANAWSDPAWGWNAPTQWFTLLGTTFAAYTAALSAGSAKFASKGARPDQEAKAILASGTARDGAAAGGPILLESAGRPEGRAERELGDRTA